MKILIIRMFPNKPKISNYNMQEIGLAKSLIKAGHECDIVYYNGNDESKEEYIITNDIKIKIFWIKGRDFIGNALYERKIDNIIRNYDIVQTSEYYQIQNIKLYKILKNKLVIYHGPYYNKIDIKLRIKMFLFDTYVNIFNRKYKNIKIITKSKLAELFLKGKEYKNVTTIGVGLDNDKIEKTEIISNLEEIEKIKTFKGNGKLIGYIGQLEKRRNIDFIINTFNKVNKENKNAKLLIIGKGKQEYEKMCIDLIKKNNLEDKIIIIKQINQDSIKEIYKLMDIFLLATSYEIYGMVLLEAMFYGVPVITTYNGGSSTIIENNKNGYILDLDEKMWTNKILGILTEKEKIDSNDISNQIKNNYTWDCLVKKFIDAYQY